MMPTVDLVFDSDCPNVPAARSQLERAFESVGLRPEWREFVNGDERMPEYARGYGSPTILVDERDVLGSTPGTASSCRVYRDESGAVAGAPTIEQIVEALRAPPR